MDFLLTIFNTFLYEPLFNALVLLQQYIPGNDFGVAVIALTFFIRLALYPVTAQGVKAQKAMNDIQPKVKELQKKFKDNKEQQTRAVLELYKQEHVNPFAGILPLLIQLPIFLALFQLFSRGFGPEQLEVLYFFVPDPGTMNLSLLGLLNLAEQSFLMALVAGALQFLQSKQAFASRGKKKQEKREGDKGKPDFGSIMQTQMIYFLPFFTVLIVSQLPAAFGLYWAVTSIVSIWQHWHMTRKSDKQEQSVQLKPSDQNIKTQTA